MIAFHKNHGRQGTIVVRVIWLHCLSCFYRMYIAVSTN